jgi:hypothetical protein
MAETIQDFEELKNRLNRLKKEIDDTWRYL